MRFLDKLEMTEGAQDDRRGGLHPILSNLLPLQGLNDPAAGLTISVGVHGFRHLVVCSGILKQRRYFRNDQIMVGTY